MTTVTEDSEAMCAKAEADAKAYAERVSGPTTSDETKNFARYTFEIGALRNLVGSLLYRARMAEDVQAQLWREIHDLRDSLPEPEPEEPSDDLRMAADFARSTGAADSLRMFDELSIRRAA